MVTKHLWTYWDQGWEEAPDLVRRCKDSWERLNPEYEFHALDRNTLFDHAEFQPAIDFKRKDITVQKIAALGRLALLAKHGGVWTDATVMCTRPLEEWLEEYYGARFFAFRNPGRARMASNWFLAAEPDSRILQRLYESFLDFYASNFFSNQDTAAGDALINFFSRRWNGDPRSTLRWHSWFARKVLRVYPYSIFHYTFNRVILTDPECERLWNEAKPFLAKAPHSVQWLEKTEDGIEKAKEEIDSGATPMQKLNWRVESTNEYWKTILPYLEQHA